MSETKGQSALSAVELLRSVPLFAGLEEVPRVENFNGLVCASFDPTIAPLQTWLGKDVCWWLNMYVLGTYVGGLEALPGFHRSRSPGNWKLTSRAVPLPVTGIDVMENFFSTLGVQPILGRSFTREETLSNAAPVVLLTYPFWKRQLGGDPNIVGKSLSLNNALNDPQGEPCNSISSEIPVVDLLGPPFRTCGIYIATRVRRGIRATMW